MLGKRVIHNGQECKVIAIYHGLPSHSDNCRVSSARQRFFDLRAGCIIHNWVYEKSVEIPIEEDIVYVQTGTGACMPVRLVKK